MEFGHEQTHNFNTFILSTAPWENETAWSDKIKWVRKYPGEVAHKRLILTHHKDLNRGHFLVDDRHNNDAAEFEGEWIQYCFKNSLIGPLLKGIWRIRFEEINRFSYLLCLVCFAKLWLIVYVVVKQ